MKTSKVLKAELLILLGVLVLWAVDLKTRCVPRAAAGALRQVVKVAPSGRAYNLLGDVYYCFGHCDEGDKAYEKAEVLTCMNAVESYPDDPNAHYNLGEAYSFAGEPERAIESLKQAVRLAPNDAGAYRAMGYIYCYDVNDPNAAVDCYEKAVQIDPCDVWGWMALGDAYTDSGHHDKAIDAYKEAIRVDPNESHAQGCLAYGYLNLGTNHGEAGQQDEAQACFERAVEADPHIANELFCWGNLFSREQSWKQAIEHYQLSLKLAPDNAKARHALGTAYLHTGNKALALQQYELLRSLGVQLADSLLKLSEIQTQAER